MAGRNRVWQGDVIIVGGGVIGTAIAHQLAQYAIKTIVLEKGVDLALGTSKANSGIVHAGFNAEPETLKGRLHLRAVQMIPELCRKLHVPFRQIGALLVAFTPEEVEQVQQMVHIGQQLGIPGVEFLHKDRLREMEPSISPEALAALHAPSGGVISPYEYTFALGENALLNGVEFAFNSEVVGIGEVAEGKEVLTASEENFCAQVVINAAGLYADQVQAMVGDEEFTITPRKGEYYLYDKTYANLAQHTIFPVPTAVSKGILVTPTVDGNLLIGPNAEEISDKTDTATTPKGLGEVYQGAKKVLPQLGKRDIVNLYAGLRAVIKETEDFYITPSKKMRGVIHVAGIQSPGLTAAPAVAEYVLELLEGLEILTLQKKEDFLYRRSAPVRFSELKREEQAELIERDRRYGQIICRCEQVTEAEIIDAIVRPLGARTIGGVKRRVRAGMGRCQGGFCGPRIMELLARYGQMDKLSLTKEGGKSLFLVDLTRSVEKAVD